MADINQDRHGYHISSDSSVMDVDAVHAYLTRSYWAEGISRALVARAINASLCFGLFDGERQVGFARVVTDRATFAYLCDVYVLEDYRARGLGRWLMDTVVAHPDLQGLRRFLLATRDAHGLYRKLTFTALARPEIFMEINRPGLSIYSLDPTD
jgi:ribosomal protein S18 acetylase RimI-like enzyme